MTVIYCKGKRWWQTAAFRELDMGLFDWLIGVDGDKNKNVNPYSNPFGTGGALGYSDRQIDDEYDEDDDDDDDED